MTQMRRLFGVLAFVCFASVVLVAQGVSETTSGVTTIPQLDMLKWQLVLSSIVSFAIQYLKKARWFTFLDMHSDAANRIVGVVLSFFSALGVSWSYDATVGTLLISGVTAAGIWGFAQEWLTNWVLQQLVYKGAVAPHAASKQVIAMAENSVSMRAR